MVSMFLLSAADEVVVTPGIAMTFITSELAKIIFLFGAVWCKLCWYAVNPNKTNTIRDESEKDLSASLHIYIAIYVKKHLDLDRSKLSI